MLGTILGSLAATLAAPLVGKIFGNGGGKQPDIPGAKPQFQQNPLVVTNVPSDSRPLPAPPPARQAEWGRSPNMDAAMKAALQRYTGGR